MRKLEKNKGISKNENFSSPSPLKERDRKDVFRDAHKSVTVDRNDFVLIQTPQCFQIPLIKKAYLQKYAPRFTDDATVVESMGVKINLIEGEARNMKITTPEDFEMAERMDGLGVSF